MSELDALYERGRDEPLSLWRQEAAAPEIYGDAQRVSFEYSSRGDRVPGRLLLPSTSAPRPLVLLQHGIGGDKDAAYMEACAPWVRGGAAVASIDFPLHGERAEGKLSGILLESAGRALEAGPEGELHHHLWLEFAQQSVLDLRRAVDALTGMPEIDADRTVYAGFSLGAMLGVLFCASDPRPRAAALALAGGGLGPAEIDPCAHVGRIAPRPLLLVNTRDDERVPRAATDALLAAAHEPKRIEWFDGGHGDLPGVALKAMWQFLRGELAL